MMFSVWNKQTQATELMSLFDMQSYQYREVLKALDWSWWRNENPEVYRTGVVAMREAFLAAESRGTEFQEAFQDAFRRFNPQGICPEFRPRVAVA